MLNKKNQNSNLNFVQPDKGVDIFLKHTKPNKVD